MDEEGNSYLLGNENGKYNKSVFSVNRTWIWNAVLPFISPKGFLDDRLRCIVFKTKKIVFNALSPWRLEFQCIFFSATALNIFPFSSFLLHAPFLYIVQKRDLVEENWC